MTQATGGGEAPSGVVRASDAERDATVERLSAATGEGRLTLAEFSQRMEQAAAARTRDELASLVTDLPPAVGTGQIAAAGAARVAVSGAASAAPSWHVTPVGGLRVYGPWRMDRNVVSVSVVGGARVDLGQAELAAPEVTLTRVSLVGGLRVWVPDGIRVEVSGFRLVGGTRLQPGPPPPPGAPTVHIRAFSLVGGVRVRRSGSAAEPQPDDWQDYRLARQADRLERRADRRSRRGRRG